MTMYPVDPSFVARSSSVLRKALAPPTGLLTCVAAWVWACMWAFMWAFVGAQMAPAHAADEFLEPELAFRPAARVADARTVEVVFDVAPGYYLYRERFDFAAVGAVLGTPLIPAGTLKFDETFNRKLETHRGAVRIRLPVQQASARFRLTVTYQGCADRGLCYPPAQLEADVSLSAFGGSDSVRVLAQGKQRH